MHDAGLPERIVPGDFGVDCGRARTVELLARWPDTDAVFALGDAATATVLGLREADEEVRFASELVVRESG